MTSAPTDPDRSLVAKAKAGDRSALEALLREYEGVVFRFAFRVCRDERKAKETAQDTFVRVLEKLGQFDGRSQFSTWVYSIVANTCSMQRRKTSKEKATHSLDEPGMQAIAARTVASPHRSMELDAELREVMDKAILELPIDQRLAFVMRDLEELSTEEAAKALGISEAALKSRLRRARVFLRERLTPYLEGSL